MFLNAIMLIGVAGAVVPLVLHLLSRARYRDVEWAAMMFLPGAGAARRSRSRWTHYILLLLRMGAVALLAIAMARPVLQGHMADASSGGRVTAALLLDCSGSMSFDENGRTRFQMAQAAARQVLRNLRPGDRVSLILMGVPQQADADLEPTGDLRSIESRIDDAKVGYGRANLRESLLRAADVLDRYERTNRDIYVICDQQALSWRGIDARWRAEWQKRMREAGGGNESGSGSVGVGNAITAERATRMFVLPVGSGDADNVAIERVQLAEPPAIFYRGPDGKPAPIDVQVTVRNYSPSPRTGLSLTVQSGSFQSASRAINLAANQSTTFTVPATFDAPGSYAISAHVGGLGGGYTLDDRMDAAVDVMAPIRVLLISGDAGSAADTQGGAMRGESEFLQAALAPHAAALGSTLASPAMTRPADAAVPQPADPFAMTIVSADRWSNVALDHFQVVILANVESFTPTQARTIERYVYGGGRVLIAPGSLSRADEYDRMLYREGAGILPAEIDAPTPADGSQSTLLLSWDTRHPIFGFLRGQYEAPAATIARYFPARPRQVDATVLAWYLAGDPFLIEGRSERGRVLLMTTALDADWTTLPLSNLYLPFVQSVVRYLASTGGPDENLAPGQAIRLALDEVDLGAKVTLTRPDGRVDNLDVIRTGQQVEIRYGDTDQPGEYQLHISPIRKPATLRRFVVRPSRDESDLTALSAQQWRDLSTGLGFERVDPAARPLRETLAKGREARELWGAGMGGVLFLLLLEMFVARFRAMAASPRPRFFARKREMPDQVENGNDGAFRTSERASPPLETIEC